MEEIVLRIRRRNGASRVHVECDWLVDGHTVTSRTPVRIKLTDGVSRLTFDLADALAYAVEDRVEGYLGAAVLFDV